MLVNKFIIECLTPTSHMVDIHEDDKGFYVEFELDAFKSDFRWSTRDEALLAVLGVITQTDIIKKCRSLS